MKRKDLLKDKAAIEEKIQTGKAQLQRWQAQLLRWDGALAYINDNLKEKKEVKDAGETTE